MYTVYTEFLQQRQTLFIHIFTQEIQHLNVTIISHDDRLMI